MTDATNENLDSNRSKLILAFAALLMLIGFVSRVAPMLDAEGRLLEQWPTEDGYYMLTISRNIGIGNGMSTADGTLPTNGIQPLNTLIYAIPYWLTDGDKRDGVLGALLMQVGFSLVAAFALFCLVRRVLSSHPQAFNIAAVTTGLWYSASQWVPHSMNCLETGLYVMMALIALNFWFKYRAFDQLWSVKQCLVFGLLLGLTFLSRNDGAFFILACCLAYTVPAFVRAFVSKQEGGVSEFKQRFWRVMLFGMTSVVVATPWLIFNYNSFGYIMPISGISESLTAKFGSNANYLPQIIVENFMVALPIPSSVQSNPVVVAGSWAAFAVIVVLLALGYRQAKNIEQRSLYVIALIYGGLLAFFYGFYFGASHFMSRYLFPTSPYTTLFTVMLVLMVASKLPAPVLRKGLVTAPLLLAAVLVVALNVRTYQLGHRHQHIQVVEWTEQNVSKDTWVGAIQTGTLGYFHDRTINLDGKVNFEVLQARMIEHEEGKSGALYRYAIERNIRYLIDWNGETDSLVHWAQDPIMAEHYEVLVDDMELNLAVLKKVTP